MQLRRTTGRGPVVFLGRQTPPRKKFRGGFFIWHFSTQKFALERWRTTMKDDLSIPSFLARTETEDQAEARRKKNAPKDKADGLKVKKLPEPKDQKIAAAIAKDFVGKGMAAQAAVDKILADVGAKQASLRKAEAEHHGRKAAPKKAGKLVERAMKVRDEMNAKAGAQKSASKPKVAEKKTAKSAPNPKGKTIGGVASAAILAGDDYEQALRKVMKAFPDCSSNVGCMAWYRNKLRKE